MFLTPSYWRMAFLQYPLDHDESPQPYPLEWYVKVLRLYLRSKFNGLTVLEACLFGRRLKICIVGFLPVQLGDKLAFEGEGISGPPGRPDE
jgi:hypothetical protein